MKNKNNRSFQKISKTTSFKRFRVQNITHVNNTYKKILRVFKETGKKCLALPGMFRQDKKSLKSVTNITCSSNFYTDYKVNVFKITNKN